MRTLQTINGDLVLEKGNLAFVEGDLELNQSTAHGLRTALGEWFLDEEFGLDHDALLGKGFNENEASDAIVECVTQDPRIARVETITYNFDNITRTLSVFLRMIKQDETTLEVEVTV